MPYTAETAPANTPILVWVRRVTEDRKGAWRMGRVVRGDGLPDQLYADGCNGPWEVPYWHPLPPAPETVP